MKYYCIEPATKDKPGLCILPTMQEPELKNCLNPHNEKSYQDYKRYIDSLEKFPTSCERVGWFEALEQFQEYQNGKWVNGQIRDTANTYRWFIVPQSEEKDGPSVHELMDYREEKAGKQNPVEQKDEPKDETDVLKTALDVMFENRALRLLLADATGLTHCESVETYRKYLPKVEPQPAKIEDWEKVLMANGYTPQDIITIAKTLINYSKSLDWVKDEEPKEKGRYFVMYHSEWDGGIVKACLTWDKFWHIRKGDKVIKWLRE
jgi:hypothetical protein